MRWLGILGTLSIIKMERAASTSGRLANSNTLVFDRMSVKTASQPRAVQRVQRRQQVCRASMGIGFHEHSSGLAVPSKALLDAEAEYGLTVSQMRVLGLTNEAMTKLPSVEAVSVGFAAVGLLLII